MIQAMYNGVSGLRAHKTMMDVISNNIANVNTAGYKSAKISFREAFNQTMRGASSPSGSGAGGTNPMQLGTGVSIASIDTNMGQGSLQSTGRLTDMAIEGNGYFTISDGSAKYFTRDGSFSLDQDGNLVSSSTGFRVLGWTADPMTGAIDSSTPIDASTGIRLPTTQLTRATTNVVFGGNLDLRTNPGSSRTVSALVYDSLGQSHTLSLAMTRGQSPISSQYYPATNSVIGSGVIELTTGTGTTGEETFNMNITPGTTLQSLATAINTIGGGSKFTATVMSDGPAGTPYYLKIVSQDSSQVGIDASGLTGAGVPVFGSRGSSWSWTATENGVQVGTGSIAFDGSGKNPTSTGDVQIYLQNGASPMYLDLDFDSLTQLAGQNTVSTISQDGLPVGTLESFTVSEDGIISGVFTNGQTQALAQVAVSGFSNAAGLTKTGNNLLIESANSGPAQISAPASGSMGSIMGGFLESSNVELATEFANMIVAQRGFQANSKIITTSDEILMELVQLKR